MGGNGRALPVEVDLEMQALLTASSLPTPPSSSPTPARFLTQSLSVRISASGAAVACSLPRPSAAGGANGEGPPSPRATLSIDLPPRRYLRRLEDSSKGGTAEQQHLSEQQQQRLSFDGDQQQPEIGIPLASPSFSAPPGFDGEHSGTLVIEEAAPGMPPQQGGVPHPAPSSVEGIQPAKGGGTSKDAIVPQSTRRSLFAVRAPDASMLESSSGGSMTRPNSGTVSDTFPDEDEKTLLLCPDGGPSSSKPPSPPPRCRPSLAVSAFSTAAATATGAVAAGGARSEAAGARSVRRQAVEGGVADASGMTDSLSRPLAAAGGMTDPLSRPLAGGGAAAGGSLMDAASEMTEFMSLPRPAAAIVEPISFPPTEEGYASQVRGGVGRILESFINLRTRRRVVRL